MYSWLVICTSWLYSRVTQFYTYMHSYILFKIIHFKVNSLISFQFSSVAQSCPTLCDPMNRSTWGLPVHHHLPESPKLSQDQGLFKWVSSSHQVTRVLEFQLQHQSFQWTPRADLLQNRLVGSPCSPRDSQEASPTPQFKSISSSALSFLYSPTLTSMHDYWKNHIFD